MKTIIAGSRGITDYALVMQAVSESGFTITELVCGCAGGVDRLGFGWARKNRVPVRFFPAWPFQEEWAVRARQTGEFVEPNYSEAGRAAGFARNGAMAYYAKEGGLIAVRSPGKSNGTDDMIKRATNLGLKVFVKRV